MAQALTVTVHHNPFLDGRAPTRIILDWVSESDGTVSLGVCSKYAAANLSAAGGNAAAIQPEKVRGVILKIESVPGLLGDLTTALPTAGHDVTLLDQYGLDVVDAKLMNRSGTAAEAVEFPYKKIISTELTLTIAGAGDTKKGRVIIDLAESEDRP